MIGEIWHMECTSYLTLTFHMDGGEGAKMEEGQEVENKVLGAPVRARASAGPTYTVC